MSSRPRASVITPYKNAEAYLADAIASVKAQTVGDWELILIDDGSTDRSHAIAWEAAQQDSRIRLLDRSAQLMRGAAAARNAGLEAGRGDFFAFLDADDMFEPEMMHVVLAAAEEFPDAGMIFGPTHWWFPGEEFRDWIEPMHGFASHLHQPPDLLRRIILMQAGHVPCTCSVLVRRSAIEQVGGFEEGFHLYEDQTLWVKLFLRYPVYVTPVCLSKYRQHSRSVSALATERGDYHRGGRHPARADFLDWLAQHVYESGTTNRRLNRAIQLARAPYETAPTLRNRADSLLLETLVQAGGLQRRFRQRLSRAATRLNKGG